MSHPKVVEKLSHGMPAFFVGKGRQFAAYVNNHHDDGRLALWLAAPPGVQESLIQEDPIVFFRPPYVGPRGWVGVNLDQGLALSVIEELIEAAYLTSAKA